MRIIFTRSNLTVEGATVRTPMLATRRAALARGMFAGLMGSGLSVGASFAAGPVLERASDTSFYRNFRGMRLRDQDSKLLTQERLLGHLVLVNFVYTGCSTVCPVQTRALADLQQQLPATVRKRVRFLSLSVDPLNDTPSALRAFAKSMGADLSNWSFATGRPEDMSRLAEALRLFRPGPDSRKPDDHATALWLVDRQGQLRMRYAGNPVDVKRLLSELDALYRMNA